MKRILLLCAIVIQLVACAGGGGGGSGANDPGSAYMPPPTPAPTPTSEPLPAYGTPVRVATVDPLVNKPDTGYKWAVSHTFTADITGNGQDLIMAGRMTQPTTTAEWGNYRMHMLSWENGTMVDKTAQWFPGGINEILGTEPSVRFADFFKTGRTDMFVGPSTDMNLHGPGHVFVNQGNKFSRLNIDFGNIWSHDSAVADLNGDGFKDIVVLDYGPGTSMAINDRVSGFQVYKDPLGNRGQLQGGSGLVVDDFLRNGQKQLVVTDSGCGIGAVNCGASSTKMFTYTLNPGANAVNYTYHSDLPMPRFLLPKWSSHGFAGNHTVRASSFDFNDDKIPDILTFSMPVPAHANQNTKYSEIQFLKNNGTGQFTDVTDSVLVGYNNNTYVSYHPQFVDINGDGRTDILVSTKDFTGANNSHQFLLKSSDGKFVAAYQNILTNFASDVNRLASTENIGNTVNLVQGPDGKLYLASAASFMNGNDRQLAIYLSPLGSQSVTSVQTAVQLIQATWPYMTERQIAQTLSTTSSSFTTSAGTGYIIDLEKIMQPYGSVGFNTQGGVRPIAGFLTGVDIGDGRSVVMDQLGRSFNMNIKAMTASGAPNAFMLNTAHIDEHNLSSHAEYLVGGPVYNINGVRVGADTRSTNFDGTNSQMLGRSSGMIPQQYTVGVPNLYRNGRATFGVQYTSLNNNPWVFMSGSWGQVNNSGILDHVFTWRDGGFSVQKGIMYTTTNITPGLVTNISPITSIWGESGYRFQRERFGDLGFYAGVKPVILSGSVEANIPTAVDNAGNTVYTKKNLALQNPVTGYARMLYTNRLDKQTVYRFSAMATQYGQYRIMHEIRWFLK